MRSRRTHLGTWHMGTACFAAGIGALVLAGGLKPAPSAPRRSGTPAQAVTDPTELVIQAQRKRIMGRLASLPHIRRVVTTIRPIIDRAIEQPAIQEDLAVLAAAARMPLARYKEYFKGKQEGDLLLESGGDPEARSVSDAIGVCQFLAGTARARGLRVDLESSRALSRRIGVLDESLEWLAAQPVSWTRAVEPPPSAAAAKKGAAPAVPVVWIRDEWIAQRRRQREELAAQRRQVDHRYDPERVIPVQTRYLVALTRRYGGVDWALQAYHGGEAGAARTMGLFAKSVGAGLHLASRGRSGAPGVTRPAGAWLAYDEVYRRISPKGTPSAFSYLFGRSDDHRYYWWKVLAAERALELFRKDTKEFERQWQELKPGLYIESAWYPDHAALSFRDQAALEAAYRNKQLVPLPPAARELKLETAGVAELDPASAQLHKGLRPESMGALLRLARLYRQSGGTEPLAVVAMVCSEEYQRRWEEKYPMPPTKPTNPPLPRDPPYLTTGVPFEVRRPTRDWDRKVLEYALGQLYDTLRISWRKETRGGRRYRVVPNPAYRDEFLHSLRAAGGPRA